MMMFFIISSSMMVRIVVVSQRAQYRKIVALLSILPGDGLDRASGENNSVDFPAALRIMGCNVQFWEGDFLDHGGCGQLPVINNLKVTQIIQAFSWQ
jgi:hypothetical protein